MDPSLLVPSTNMPPFQCSMLPSPFDKQCQSYQRAYPDTHKSDCANLPGTYKQFCNSLPPPDSVNPNGVTNIQSFNPSIMPNKAAFTPDASRSQGGACYQNPLNCTGPAGLAHARQACAAVGPRNFYTCLWQTTRYPPYPELFQDQQNTPCGANNLINNDNKQCLAANSRNNSVWPCPDTWQQLPSNVTCSTKTPVVWGMKK